MAIIEAETGRTSDVDSLLEAALAMQVEELPGGRDEHGNTHVLSLDGKLVGAAAMANYVPPDNTHALYIDGVYTDPSIYEKAYLAVVLHGIDKNRKVGIIYGVEDDAVARVAEKIAGCLPVKWRLVDISEDSESASHAFMHAHSRHPADPELV